MSHYDSLSEGRKNLTWKASDLIGSSTENSPTLLLTINNVTAIKFFV